MYKKYIIENNDLSLLPSAYVNLGKRYSSNFDKINRSISKIKEAKLLINKLENNIDILTKENINLYNQLKFIKKNYLPRIYINIYVKNNKPVKYVNLIIKYFDYSRTIYLGKYLIIEKFLLDNSSNNSVKNFSVVLYNYLKPVVFDKCKDLKNKSEFINLALSSSILFSSKNFDNKHSQTSSFSSYLKQFE
tara:strand:+ start:44 stop:616 length:573 start_codon:yes stop_codon:yes gene_type:complete